MPHTKDKLRRHLKENLPQVIDHLNEALSGKNLSQYASILAKLGRGRHLPHWYNQLKKNRALPNLDGKTIGSVLEMLFVAVLERHIFVGGYAIQLRINPASGIDLPDLDLGIKTPSKNYCTSEPFFSAYERLHGTEYDVLVLLTDYQEAKRNPPLRLRVIDHDYLLKTQVADTALCNIARGLRERLLAENESRAKKIFRFLAHVNQADWRGKRLLKLIETLYDDTIARALIASAEDDFVRINTKRADESKEPIPQEDLDALKRIEDVHPLHLGIIDAADNWVIETHKEFGRYPSDAEWHRLRSGPLDGRIGMSFALQWRFNFGGVFRDDVAPNETGQNCN